MFNLSSFLLRYLSLILSVAALLTCSVMSMRNEIDPLWVVPGAALSLLGIGDILQRSHAVLYNYPIIGHLRYALEGVRTEVRQYFIEGDREELPFSRAARTLAYNRAHNLPAEKGFGTLNQVYDNRHEFLCHSLAPVEMDVGELRVVLGGPDCRQPYDASLLNISAMSFGALGANAIQALARGAAKGLFALDTGEGGISKYHLSEDNDLIYEIGSGYFGCRNSDGTFSSQLFAQQAARPNVKAVLVKNSQGSKPSRGGILPAEKVSAEIAIARGVPMGQDCISPPKHSAFTGPDGLMRFVLELRNLSLGKPIGFKLCIGKPVEAAALVKAMLHTGITPDFIVIDGSEGGTGAAPVEFADNVGMPLREGLLLMNNLLRGAGLRDQIKLIASGKVISGFDIIRLLALGADMANSARGFMFALGCIAGQSCHKNTCPTGIATQDPLRQRALNVGIKSEQVYNFHRNTLASVAEILSAAGLQSARQVTPELIMRRIADNEIRSYAQLYTFLHHRELIEGRSASEFYREIWARARHDTYESA